MIEAKSANNAELHKHISSVSGRDEKENGVGEATRMIGAKSLRQLYILPFLDVRPDIELICKAGSGLGMEIPIRIGDLCQALAEYFLAGNSVSWFGIL